MHEAASLEFHPFSEAAFGALSPSRQLRYLYCYLRDLDAQVVIAEPHYFDKDYLSEFAAFYSVSSRGYPNTCRRLHFFSGQVTRELFVAAVSGKRAAITQLQQAYLGFCVVRPIPAAPLGCTVLAWYPDIAPDTRRVTSPSREYHCHLAGLKLSVTGLAWQQQDSAVGACATVGLWSMLHASSFDNDHSAPTTAQITEAAHQTAVTGARVFPSNGLTIIQLLEAIKRYHMAPFVMSGDIRPSEVTVRAENIRRNAGFSTRAVKAADESLKHVYIHDDNLGPNVRFAVKTRSQYGHVMLFPDPPENKRDGVNASPTLEHPGFVPQQLVVCTHEDLRTSPDKLNGTGLKICADISVEMNRLLERSGMSSRGLVYSCRFMLLRDYLASELAKLFDRESSSHILGRVRLDLVERVVPMSKHVGVVRIAFQDSTPLVDVLHDTTDSDINHPVFAHVCFGSNVSRILQRVDGYAHDRFGTQIKAFDE